MRSFPSGTVRSCLTVGAQLSVRQEGGTTPLPSIRQTEYRMCLSVYLRAHADPPVQVVSRCHGDSLCVPERVPVCLCRSFCGWTCWRCASTRCRPTPACPPRRRLGWTCRLSGRQRSRPPKVGQGCMYTDAGLYMRSLGYCTHGQACREDAATTAHPPQCRNPCTSCIIQ